jgi:hypothetical protein
MPEDYGHGSNDGEIEDPDEGSDFIVVIISRWGSSSQAVQPWYALQEENWPLEYHGQPDLGLALFVDTVVLQIAAPPVYCSERVPLSVKCH